MESFTIDLASLARPYQETQERLARLQFTSSLWSRQVEMWTDDLPTQQKIANRLGWLGALDFVTPHLERVRAAAERARTDGLTDIVLLGMGGSSLAPEVMRRILGVAEHYPRFRMLDSVDPDAVDEALSRVEHTLFLFASKSGGTIEPNAMAAEAARRLEARGIRPWGSRFIAITDEGTALHRRAVAEKFRDIFINPSDIGGRYSALSFFGVVPAALMGMDLDTFLARAQAMAKACQTAGPDNPGTALGAFMAAGARSGRDKLTLLLPERFMSFGLWVEQLVAESTGKNGVGVVPIAGEPADAELGADRTVVAIHVGGESPAADRLSAIARGGVPCAHIHVEDERSLGAEFLRWEIATAAAGRLLDVNPFDEPNVQQAKDAAKTLLDAFTSTGSLPGPRVDRSSEGANLTLSQAARQATTDPTRVLGLAGPGDYVSIMAFLPPDAAALSAALDDLRAAISLRTGRPTMFGYGPRYLHSTGQLHKGGANNGVFLLISAPPSTDFPVPDAPYSFATLEQAQALGDFNSLEQTGRRALLAQLTARTPDAIADLSWLLTG